MPAFDLKEPHQPGHLEFPEMPGGVEDDVCKSRGRPELSGVSGPASEAL